MGSKRELDNPLSPDLDTQLESVQNISEQITSQLKLNVNTKKNFRF